VNPCVKILSLVVATLPLFTSFGRAQAETKNLTVKSAWVMPMKEVSGLSISGDRLFSLSDREHDLLSIPLVRSDDDAVRTDDSTHKVLSIDIPDSEQAQWEAVNVNEQSGVFGLKETSNQIFHFDNEGRRLKTYDLANWSGRKNSDRGLEGMLLMRGGHFLIALEADQAALIEYGPKGEAPIGLSSTSKSILASNEAFAAPSSNQLVPLAAWTLADAGSCQFSDLARASDGSVLVLGKGCMKVMAVKELKIGSVNFKVSEQWSIPSEVDHPEGIQVLGNNSFLISSDLQAIDKNLYLLNY
jgi:hypothetical protein